MPHASRQTVCMIAMGLSNCTEVEGKLKNFIASANKKCKGSFTGHTNKNSAQILQLVTTWCLEQNIVSIHDPPAVNSEGKQRIYPENVLRVQDDYLGL